MSEEKGMKRRRKEEERRIGKEGGIKIKDTVTEMGNQIGIVIGTGRESIEIGRKDTERMGKTEIDHTGTGIKKGKGRKEEGKKKKEEKRKARRREMGKVS